MKRGIIGVVILSLGVAGAFFDVAVADRYTSTSYIIDASVMNTAGGSQTSTTYRLTISTGEAAIGDGASGSYKMGYGYASQLDKSLALTVQPSGLVAAYSLDEATGAKLADDSIYAAYGTMAGTLSSVAGKLGTALGFDGTTQAVNVPSNSQTQVSSSATVEAWAKSTSTALEFIVSKSGNYAIGLSGGRAIAYNWVTDTACDTGVSVNDGNWHHIATSISGGQEIVYVDGIARQTCVWAQDDLAQPLIIGSTYYAGGYHNYFTGAIDHPKLFNRALSAGEIRAEYDAQNSGYDSGLALGTITPGASNTALSDIIVQTDAGGYTLAVNQNNNLTSGVYTIPSVSGSIASPVSWSEGTTKGLGFTLTATNATALPGVWSSGNSYAALPSTATSFYTRTGVQSSTGDYITMRLRADVDTTQPTTTGSYSNIMTVTGTITP